MLICRLCLTKTNDFKHLCDENGEDSEIYHITVKYFDPMMVSLLYLQFIIMCPVLFILLF